MDARTLKFLSLKAANSRFSRARQEEIYEKVRIFPPGQIGVPRTTSLSEEEQAARVPMLRALAINRSSPSSILYDLGELFPHEVASNSALEYIPYSCAEQGDVLFGMESLPLHFLQQATKSDSYVTRAKARSHIKLAGEAGPEWEAEVHADLRRSWDFELLNSYTLASLRSTHWHVDIRLIRRVLQSHEACRWVLVPLEEALALCNTAALRATVCDSPLISPLVQLLRRAGCNARLTEFAEPDLTLSPEEVYDLLTRGRWGTLVAARHPHLSPEVRDNLVAVATGQSGQDVPMLLSLAANPEIPAIQLEQWSRHKVRGVREAVACHPSTPPSALWHLASDTTPQVRLKVARHPAIGQDALELLASSADSRVRGAVARNAHCPPALLELLSYDDNAFVRLDVARHPQTPQATLQLLAEDEDADILGVLARRADFPAALRAQLDARRAAATSRGLSRTEEQKARDRHATPQELAQLAASASEYVRCLVAQHPHTAPEIVVSLIGQLPVAYCLTLDTRLSKRQIKVSEIPNVAPMWKHMAEPEVPRTLLQLVCEAALGCIRAARESPPNNWEASVRLLRELANANQILERAWELPELSSYWRNSLLDRLQAAVAISPQQGYALGYEACAQQLERLQQQWVGKSQDELAQRAFSPDQSVALLARVPLTRFDLQADLRTMLGHYGTIRAAALCHPAVPSEELQSRRTSGICNLALMKDEEFRLAAVRNPASSRALIEELARDGHRWVRAAAQQALKERFEGAEV